MERRSIIPDEVRRYEQDVLQLNDTRNESDLNEQHQSDAQALGVDVSRVCPSAPSCISSSTVSSVARRSESVDSHQSASTGLTSNFSRNSKDFQLSPVSPSFHNRITIAKPHSNTKSVQSTIASPSLTALPPTPASPTSPTTLSRLAFRPLSPSFTSPISFNKGFSVRRGFGRISRLGRSNTSSRIIPMRSSQPSPLFVKPGDPHFKCSDSVPAPASAVPRLQTQQSSTLGDRGEDPRLGLEQHSLNEGVPLRPKTSSLPENRRPGSSILSEQTRGRAASQGDNVPRSMNATASANIDDAQRNLDFAMTFPDFRSIRSRQEHERDRFLVYHQAHKRELEDKYQARKRELLNVHAHIKDDLCAMHPSELSSLEDRHIIEEMELRESQQLEFRNCEIALKHMQGYCRSSSDASCETSQREVTLQDRRNLERQYWLRNNLPRRHESAVNIMRERQGRQLRTRSLKQMSQVSDLQSAQEKEIRDLDNKLQSELRELDSLVLQRKERLIYRWTLTVEIWKHCREQDEKTIITLPIKAISWPDALDAR